MKDTTIAPAGRPTVARTRGRTILTAMAGSLRIGRFGGHIKKEKARTNAAIETGNLTILGLRELTIANSSRFRKRVCAALNGRTVVEVDLSQMASMDCAGFGALIAIRKLIRRRGNGVVRLLNPAAAVRQMLDLMRAGQLFEIVDTPAAWQGTNPLTAPAVSPTSPGGSGSPHASPGGLGPCKGRSSIRSTPRLPVGAAVLAGIPVLGDSPHGEPHISLQPPWVYSEPEWKPN